MLEAVGSDFLLSFNEIQVLGTEAPTHAWSEIELPRSQCDLDETRKGGIAEPEATCRLPHSD